MEMAISRHEPSRKRPLTMQITPILLLLAAGFLQLFQSIFWLLMNSLQPEMDWKLRHVIGSVVPNGLIVLFMSGKQVGDSVHEEHDEHPEV